jgi:hypothetical protein
MTRIASIARIVGLFTLGSLTTIGAAEACFTTQTKNVTCTNGAIPFLFHQHGSERCKTAERDAEFCEDDEASPPHPYDICQETLYSVTDMWGLVCCTDCDD